MSKKKAKGPSISKELREDINRIGEEWITGLIDNVLDVAEAKDLDKIRVLAMFNVILANAASTFALTELENPAQAYKYFESIRKNSHNKYVEALSLVASKNLH